MIPKLLKKKKLHLYAARLNNCVFSLLTKGKDSELLTSELPADNYFVCVLVKLGLSKAHSQPVVNVDDEYIDVCAVNRVQLIIQTNKCTTHTHTHTRI